MPIDRRISLHKLTVLSLVVELDSVSRAAERLMVSQPVVSAHLRSLEEAFDCAIWETRGGRRRLTTAGRAVLRFAHQTLRATGELERHLEGVAAAGTKITLSASVSVGSYRLATVLARLLLANPTVEVRQQITDVARIVDLTAAGTVDFGLVLGDAALGEHSSFNRRLLELHEIGREQLVLLSAPGFWPQGVAMPVEMLSGIDLIDGHGADGVDATVSSALAAAGVEVSIGMELGDPEAVKRVLTYGGFVAFLPLSAAAKELERGELEIVGLDWAPLEVPVNLLVRAGRELSGPERDLVDAMRADYAAVLE